MFQRYPDTYKIPVYKTQRTASSPQDIYAAVKSSALNTVAVKDGYGLQNFEKSHYTAFPIPKSGLEVVLNHLTRYRGTSFMQNLVQVTSQVNGSYTLVNVQQSVGFPWQMKDTDSQQSANVLFYAKKEVTSLARMAGNVLLVHEAIDQLKDPRMAWSYRRSTSCAAQPG
nr:DUF1329 domain-containing protein [Pseudomonas sp. Irchel s3h17]